MLGNLRKLAQFSLVTLSKFVCFCGHSLLMLDGACLCYDVHVSIISQLVG